MFMGCLLSCSSFVHCFASYSYFGWFCVVICASFLAFEFNFAGCYNVMCLLCLIIVVRIGC